MGYSVKASTTSESRLSELASVKAGPFIINIESLTSNIQNFLQAKVLIINVPSKNMNGFSNLKKEIEQMRLIDFEVKSKIIVREETIEAYYKDHIDEFKTEDKVRLAIILLLKEDASLQDKGLTLSQQAEQLVSRLENGEDFAALAKQNSQKCDQQTQNSVREFKLAFHATVPRIFRNSSHLLRNAA